MIPFQLRREGPVCGGIASIDRCFRSPAAQAGAQAVSGTKTIVSILPTGEMLDQMRAIALQAGHLVMEIYRTDFSIRGKDDASPVTLADECAEAAIIAALARIAPDIPVVAEEAAAAGLIPVVRDRFWLVDPLDGTKEFIQRNGEFTINIALVQDGTPLLGVVYAPAIGRLFAGEVGVGAYVEDAGVRCMIRCRTVPPAGLTVVASRSHVDPAALEAFLRGHPIATVKHAGSSLKLCLVAAGEADLYPRLGRTMEWDVAAGHAVLAAAGGQVRDLSGMPLRYGKPGFDNPHFVATGLDA